MNDLSMHIIDIIQNSLRAGATLITVTIEEDREEDLLVITVEDNGCGMSSEQVTKLNDPFFTSRTTRRVGMGVPLLKQTAEQSGGELVIKSEPGIGTTVKASFGYSHIDRPPLGDVANAFMLMVSANPEIDFILRYVVGNADYLFNTVEIKRVLEGIPVNEPSVIRALTEMIRENIEDLKKKK
jgi:hypothetical protein